MTKLHLTRGIDEFPPGWEIASGWVAMKGLMRARNSLEKMRITALTVGDKKAAAALARAATACSRGLQHITGGFDCEYIKPKVDQWAAAEKAAKELIRG